MGSVGLTLLLSVTAAHAAENNAEALMQAGRRVAAEARTLRADLVVVARNGDTAKGTLTAMRPNFFRIRLRGAGGESEVCSDGKNVFYSYPDSRGYLRMPMKDGAESTRFLEAVCPPAVAFLDPDTLTRHSRLRAAGPIGVATSVAHEQYSGVELLSDSPGVRTWYFNEQGFPAGAVLREGETASVWLQNNRLGAPLRARDFLFELPAGQKPLLPGDGVEGLRPVGSVLPDFSLPGVAGLQVTLAGLRARAKAVLVYHGTRDPAESQEDLPLLQKLGEQLGKQVEIVAVFPQGTAALRRADRTRTRITLLMDETGTAGRAARPTGGSQSPATYLVDAEGRILWTGRRPNAAQIQEAVASAWAD
jgi:outer membrane lipoprotein-sorting protein/peroxiredoxin